MSAANTYKRGDYYLGVDQSYYVYNGSSWEKWLFDGIPTIPGGNMTIPPAGLAGVVSGANVPAVGTVDTSKLRIAVPGPQSSQQSSLRYPDDITPDTDWVLFEFYDYVPPFQVNSSLTGGSGSETYNKARQYTKNSLKSVCLYMPEDVSTGYRSQWSGRNFSNVARDLLQTASAPSALEGVEEAVSGATRALDTSVAILGAKVISGVVSKITGESLSLDDVFGGTRGVILNPNTELLFGGIDLRNFNLVYKLVPRNTTEAKTIPQIINQFKKAMLPKTAAGNEFNFAGWLTGGTSVQDSFIKVPNLCKVNFMKGSGENPNLNKYKMCAITQVDVNYTPDGAYATLEGGEMVAIGLTLSFQETSLVFSEDVEAGY